MNPHLWERYVEMNGITHAVIVRHDNGWSITTGTLDGNFYPGTSAKVYRHLKDAKLQAHKDYDGYLPIRVDNSY
jgi:hypothetical protein